MSKAEMILKLVMAPSESSHTFVESYINLIEDYDIVEFQKLLEMKGLFYGYSFSVVIVIVIPYFVGQGNGPCVERVL